MRKSIGLLLLVLGISSLGSMAGASIVQYNLSGNIPLSKEIYDPEYGTSYEIISLAMNGTCYISDEDLLPDDPYHDYFNIMGYNINIEEYNFIDNNMPGLIRFCSLDVYISLAGGNFTECFRPPHELPSSFTVYSSIRPPTDWFSQLYSYSDYTFHPMSLKFERAPAPVPEPSTLLLLGSCIPAFALLRRRFNKNS